MLSRLHSDIISTPKISLLGPLFHPPVLFFLCIISFSVSIPPTSISLSLCFKTILWTLRTLSNLSNLLLEISPLCLLTHHAAAALYSSPYSFNNLFQLQLILYYLVTEPPLFFLYTPPPNTPTPTQHWGQGLNEQLEHFHLQILEQV